MRSPVCLQKIGRCKLCEATIQISQFLFRQRPVKLGRIWTVGHYVDKVAYSPSLRHGRNLTPEGTCSTLIVELI